MPRRRNSPKTAKIRKDQQQAAQALSPKSDPGAALRQTLLEFQPDAGYGLASSDAPVTPPPTPNGGLSSGSASPESIVSFAKEEETSAVVGLTLEENGSGKAARKQKVRSKAKLKPPSPMKRERAEEIFEKPPSPMKKEKAEDTSCLKEEKTEDISCLKEEKAERDTSCLKEKPEEEKEDASCLKAEKAKGDTSCLREEKAEESVSDKKVEEEGASCLKEKGDKVRATLDDYFGCSPHEAEKKGRGRIRRSKSAAAAPRRTKPNLEPFSLDRHFPIQRRSSRRDEKMLKEMTEREIQRRVLNNIEEGMKVVDFEMKGRGVVATRRFERDEFVVEYAGNLVTDAESKRLNAAYAQNPEVGSYMFWIMHRGRKFCVDATAESGRFGRLINHSRTAGNLKPKVLEYAGKPRLLLFTTRQVFPGEELLYDYGDRDKQTLEEFPWLKS